MTRAADLADRLVQAAHRVTRLNADVTMLAEHALDAARMLRDKADAIDSYDVAYVRCTLERMAKQDGSQKALAGALGVSESYLSDVILGRREPGDKLLDAMGLERVVTYRNKEMP